MGTLIRQKRRFHKLRRRTLPYTRKKREPESFSLALKQIIFLYSNCPRFLSNRYFRLAPPRRLNWNLSILVTFLFLSFFYQSWKGFKLESFLYFVFRSARMRNPQTILSFAAGCFGLISNFVKSLPCYLRAPRPLLLSIYPLVWNTFPTTIRNQRTCERMPRGNALRFLFSFEWKWTFLPQFHRINLSIFFFVLFLRWHFFGTCSRK